MMSITTFLRQGHRRIPNLVSLTRAKWESFASLLYSVMKNLVLLFFNSPYGIMIFHVVFTTRLRVYPYKLTMDPLWSLALFWTVPVLFNPGLNCLFLLRVIGLSKNVFLLTV